jgi:electron transport complex protein RnfB
MVTAAGPARRALPVALIDEALCIGCTICIQKCPVDAIVGSGKRMHTVIAAQCIGCRLCVAPCPVDCITMVPAAPDAARVAPDVARDRHRFRQVRLARTLREQAARFGEQAKAKLARIDAMPAEAAADADTARKRAVIERALARAKARQAGGGREPDARIV